MLKDVNHLRDIDNNNQFNFSKNSDPFLMNPTRFNKNNKKFIPEFISDRIASRIYSFN